jgi:hypothetical protein
MWRLTLLRFSLGQAQDRQGLLVAIEQPLNGFAHIDK